MRTTNTVPTFFRRNVGKVLLLITLAMLFSSAVSFAVDLTFRSINLFRIRLGTDGKGDFKSDAWSSYYWTFRGGDDELFLNIKVKDSKPPTPLYGWPGSLEPIQLEGAYIEAKFPFFEGAPASSLIAGYQKVNYSTYVFRRDGSGYGDNPWISGIQATDIHLDRLKGRLSLFYTGDSTWEVGAAMYRGNWGLNSIRSTVVSYKESTQGVLDRALSLEGSGSLFSRKINWDGVFAWHNKEADFLKADCFHKLNLTFPLFGRTEGKVGFTYVTPNFNPMFRSQIRPFSWSGQTRWEWNPIDEHINPLVLEEETTAGQTRYVIVDYGGRKGYNLGLKTTIGNMNLNLDYNKYRSLFRTTTYQQVNEVLRFETLGRLIGNYWLKSSYTIERRNFEGEEFNFNWGEWSLTRPFIWQGQRIALVLDRRFVEIRSNPDTSRWYRYYDGDIYEVDALYISTKMTRWIPGLYLEAGVGRSKYLGKLFRTSGGLAPTYKYRSGDVDEFLFLAANYSLPKGVGLKLHLGTEKIPGYDSNRIRFEISYEGRL